MGELGEFVRHEDDFKALDVQVLAISVDPAERGKWVEEKLKAPFPILSDSKHEVTAPAHPSTTIERAAASTHRLWY